MTTDVAVPAKVWRLAAVIAFGGVMAGLDTSVANVGLEAIARDLRAELGAVQWVSTGFLIALAAALPACGWLSRRFGGGRVWLAALAAFTVASALCAAAQSVEVLIAFRVVQGIAGGLLVPAGMAILGQAAGKARMGRVMSTSAIPAILAPAIGPVVGALLIAHLSWQWMFLINVPIGVVGLVLGLRAVPRGERAGGEPLDVLGLVLVGAGLPALIQGVTGGSTVALTAGVAALVAFVVRSLRRPAPLLDLRLFRVGGYAAAGFVVMVNGAALFGGMIVMPLYFQLLRGEGIVGTGLLLMAFSLGAAAMFPVAGRLTDRYGGGVVTVTGLVVTIVTTVPLALLPADVPLLAVEVLQVLRGAGLALAGMPAAASAFAMVERHQIPDATAQMNILNRVGGALGGVAFVAVLTAHLDAGPDAAFRTTFWWLAAAAAGGLAGAAWLAVAQRRRPA